MKLLFTLGIAASLLGTPAVFLLAAAPAATQPGTITGPGHSPPRSVSIGVMLDPAEYADVTEVRAVANGSILTLRIEREGQKPLVVGLPARGEPVPGLSPSQNAAVRSVVDWERRSLLHGLGITAPEHRPGTASGRAL